MDGEKSPRQKTNGSKVKETGVRITDREGVAQKTRDIILVDRQTYRHKVEAKRELSPATKRKGK